MCILPLKKKMPVRKENYNNENSNRMEKKSTRKERLIITPTFKWGTKDVREGEV